LQAGQPLAQHHPGSRHRSPVAWSECAWRRPSRCARPASQRPGVSPSGIALDVRDLTTTLFLREAEVDVVRGISFQLREGWTLALVGESGCGKTMAALSVMRLLPDPPARVTGGQVLLAGKDSRSRPERDMR